MLGNLKNMKFSKYFEVVRIISVANFSGNALFFSGQTQDQ